MIKGRGTNLINKMITVALSPAAGLTGGLLTRYITPATAYAQASVTKEVRARSFTLVDDLDRPVGTFTIDPPLFGANPLPPSANGSSSIRRIVLLDNTGKEIWSAGGCAHLLNESVR